jgi:hypothetical protein
LRTKRYNTRLKWLLVAAVVGVVTPSAYLIHARIESKAEKTLEADYESKLREYAEQFKTGLSRRQIEAQLTARGIPFHRICCLHTHDYVLADIVKISEEKGPWYCSGILINVAFEFHADEAQDPLKGNETDVLDKVSIFRQGDGCL